ncbi:MAG: glutamate racemase [Chitinophagales bacterium]|nr:glutamate racemase [Chitinophagaceae bacterium]MCB9065246.1 glutamate racemase [Chitinophagales bacterium]
MHQMRPIGIFDSGFGGLTVFRAIKNKLPQYDYLYLGDNARAPYGNKSFEEVYEYTLQSVKWMFAQGCPLIILACNTASAQVLRKIQQDDMPTLGAHKRVLGVIRPTSEIIGEYTKNNAVGILATQRTVNSNTYPEDIHERYPEVEVYQQACPMWVRLIEDGQYKTDAMDKYIKEDVEALLEQSGDIDTIILGCTHYPLVADRIKQHLPEGITLVSQVEIVADSLVDYLSRHKFIEEQITTSGNTRFYTTDPAEEFNKHGVEFFGEEVQAEHIKL